MVKNSSSVDVYMVIIILDTKVTVNQPITKYINQKKDYNGDHNLYSEECIICGIS